MDTGNVSPPKVASNFTTLVPLNPNQMHCQNREYRPITTDIFMPASALTQIEAAAHPIQNITNSAGYSQVGSEIGNLINSNLSRCGISLNLRRAEDWQMIQELGSSEFAVQGVTPPDLEDINPMEFSCEGTSLRIGQTNLRSEMASPIGFEHSRASNIDDYCSNLQDISYHNSHGHGVGVRNILEFLPRSITRKDTSNLTGYSEVARYSCQYEDFHKLPPEGRGDYSPNINCSEPLNMIGRSDRIVQYPEHSHVVPPIVQLPQEKHRLRGKWSHFVTDTPGDLSVNNQSDLRDLYTSFGGNNLTEYTHPGTSQPHYSSKSSNFTYLPRQMRMTAVQEEVNDENLSRDEKLARALNLPFSMDEIINSPIEEFNEKLMRKHLSQRQIAIARDIRRRGKNKVAAQSCRRRKIDKMNTLESENSEKRKEQEEEKEMNKRLKERFEHLKRVTEKLQKYLHKRNVKL